MILIKLIKLIFPLLLLTMVHSEPITFTITTQEARFNFNGTNFENEDLVVTLTYDTNDIKQDSNNGGLLYENSVVTYTSVGAGFQNKTGTTLYNIAFGFSESFGDFQTIFLLDSIDIGIGINNTTRSNGGSTNYNSGTISTYDGVSNFFAAGTNTAFFESIEGSASTIDDPLTDTFSTGETFQLNSFIGRFFGSGQSVTFTADSLLDVPEPQTFFLLLILAVLGTYKLKRKELK